MVVEVAEGEATVISMVETKVKGKILGKRAKLPMRLQRQQRRRRQPRPPGWTSAGMKDTGSCVRPSSCGTAAAAGGDGGGGGVGTS